MKCPECGTNHRRGKEGMSCRCGYEFRLDPKVFRGFTDGKFLTLVRQASLNDTFYFTKNQLWNRYCQMRGIHLLPAIGWLSGIWVVILFFKLGIWTRGFSPLLSADNALLLVTPPACLLILAALLRFRILPMGGRKEFEKILTRWLGSSSLSKLITEPSLHDPPPDWNESDIYDYGVERILIVDNDLTVDWLVLNGFFTQSRALILSVGGYPEYLIPRTRKILEDHPDTPVFLLHDATPEGMAAEDELRRQAWLPLRDRPIVDLGLTPADIRKLQALRHMKPSTVQYQMPLDVIIYPMLAAGLTDALAQGLPLGDLIEQSAQGDGGGPGGFG